MRKIIALLAAAGVLGGCADTMSIRPAPSANVVPVPGPATGAIDSVAGVQVTVVPREWPGNVPISTEVTPLKVRVNNNSGERVAVRYSEIKLVAPDGRMFSALPPASITQNVNVPQPRLAPGYVPITPGFAGAGFGVDPLYSPLYPGMPVVADGLFYDPLYYRSFGNYWRTVGLPTPQMLSLALPEGVIGPGGYVEGYLYFQEVPSEVPRVSFRMDVLNAGQGAEMGTIEIPFVVS
jgi:hypothetical protein